MRDLINRAEGIFQLASIVVRSIRDEVGNMGGVDDVKLLKKHLDALPREINKLYRHLLDLLPPRTSSKSIPLARNGISCHQTQPTYHSRGLLALWRLRYRHPVHREGLFLRGRHASDSGIQPP